MIKAMMITGIRLVLLPDDYSDNNYNDNFVNTTSNKHGYRNG